MGFVPAFSEPDAQWSGGGHSPPSTIGEPRHERRTFPLGEPPSRAAPRQNSAQSPVRKSVPISTTLTIRGRI